MKKGLTIIEAMIIVAIVCLLAGIAVPAILKVMATEECNKNIREVLHLELISTQCPFYYSLDNRTVVAVNADGTEILRTIGTIGIPLSAFRDLSDKEKLNVINYKESPMVE